MEPRGLMPHSQELSNNPYPEPNQPNSIQSRSCVTFLNEDDFYNTKKYHVFAPMGRFKLESIYLFFHRRPSLW